jgi:hypothetical protein
MQQRYDVALRVLCKLDLHLDFVGLPVAAVVIDVRAPILGRWYIPPRPSACRVPTIFSPVLAACAREARCEFVVGFDYRFP